jgi:dTDP-4-dehydrorhamnose 3,5-epimerase
MTAVSHVAQIDGVRIIHAKSVTDARGAFIKFHPLQELDNSLDSVALSINPIPGTVRGLHFQVEPFAEEKLVACVQGSIFDVIVDLRPSSKTFGKWTSFELSAVNGLQAYLPKGIAHGFQTLVPDSIIHYGLSASYSAKSSYSIDPFGDLGIAWPLKEFSISEKDARGVSLSFAAQKYTESLGS